MFWFFLLSIFQIFEIEKKGEEKKGKIAATQWKKNKWMNWLRYYVQNTGKQEGKVEEEEEDDEEEEEEEEEEERWSWWSDLWTRTKQEVKVKV